MTDVRITAEVYGRPFKDGHGSDSERFGVSVNNEPIKVDIDLWKCDRCAALTLREDSLTHEVFHEGQDSRMEAIEERVFGS